MRTERNTQPETEILRGGKDRCMKLRIVDRIIIQRVRFNQMTEVVWRASHRVKYSRHMGRVFGKKWGDRLSDHSRCGWQGS
jgi:hypothetical protein